MVRTRIEHRAAEEMPFQESVWEVPSQDVLETGVTQKVIDQLVVGGIRMYGRFRQCLAELDDTPSGEQPDEELVSHTGLLRLNLKAISGILDKESPLETGHSWHDAFDVEPAKPLGVEYPVGDMNRREGSAPIEPAYIEAVTRGPLTLIVPA